MNKYLRAAAAATIGKFPVRVRAGAAQGARWTLFPWTSYWRGAHEPEIQTAFMGLGDITGWACWDLGAHFGIYSVALAMRVGPTGQVAAFEPNPLSFRRLERHRRMNGLLWMKTYSAAVSDRSGRAQLLTYGELDSTSTHLAYADEASGPSADPVAISTLCLDDEVESGRLRPPSFVKVDVEGHGGPALRGMARTLAASRPTMIIGFHCAEEVSGVLEVLEPLRYTWTAICNGSESLVGGDYLFRPPKG